MEHTHNKTYRVCDTEAKSTGLGLLNGRQVVPHIPATQTLIDNKVLKRREGDKLLCCEETEGGEPSNSLKLNAM
jgi:hypothetical protein